MKVALGSDHRGVAQRRAALEWLGSHGHEAIDFGVDSEASVDYPDYAFKVAELVGEGRAEAGVLICDTGIGMSIAANKVENVRAALVDDPAIARRTREHNNSNVLVLAAERVPPSAVGALVEAFLATPFEGGRHERRVGKIRQYELEHGAAGRAGA